MIFFNIIKKSRYQDYTFTYIVIVMYHKISVMIVCKKYTDRLVLV